MYHYDPETALEELSEDAMLPHPVHVRDIHQPEVTAYRAVRPTNRILRQTCQHFATDGNDSNVDLM
jgi:hypothetical protein